VYLLVVSCRYFGEFFCYIWCYLFRNRINIFV